MKEKVVRCARCHKRFTIGVLELEYFMTIGLDMPNSCPACRKFDSMGIDWKEKRKSRDKKKYFRRKYDEI